MVKAPTLVCDDGTARMDSGLILAYAQALAEPRSLMPAGLGELKHALRVIGLALAACDKSVKIVYERQLRPPEKRHEPRVARVTGQLLAAFAALEEEAVRRPLAGANGDIDQAGVSAAVAWYFAQQKLGEVVPAAGYPTFVAFSAWDEALPAFAAATYGDGPGRFEG